MQRQPERTRDEADEELVIAEIDATRVASLLARTIDEGDARGFVALLDTHVKAREGSSFCDAGLEPEDLALASEASGYREVATLTLSRAMGPSRTARLLVDLLVAAPREPVAEGALAERLAASSELFDATLADAAKRSPAMIRRLARVAPEAARLTRAELRRLGHAETRSPQSPELIAALPRLALGPPPLDGEGRRIAEQLVSSLAARPEPIVPLVLTALMEAGATRERLGTSLERAIESGVLANVRALEDAGARRPPTRTKKAKKRRDASIRELQRRRDIADGKERAKHVAELQKADAKRGKARRARPAPPSKELPALPTTNAFTVLTILVCGGGTLLWLLYLFPEYVGAAVGLVIAGLIVAATGKLGRGARR